MNPERFEELKKQWDDNEPLNQYKSALQTEQHKKMAHIMHKRLDHLRIDETIMVPSNVVLEPIRWVQC